MNPCALCMTELHPQAVVSFGCGASRVQVRKAAGSIRGLGILGLSLIALLLLMPGRFMAGFIVPSLPEDQPAPPRPAPRAASHHRGVSRRRGRRDARGARLLSPPRRSAMAQVLARGPVAPDKRLVRTSRCLHGLSAILRQHRGPMPSASGGSNREDFMKRTLLALAGLGAMLAGGLVAQQPTGRQPTMAPAAQHQVEQAQRLQEMQQRMERLATQLRETNRWMEQNRAQQQFRDLGKVMQETGDQVRDMLRQMDRIHQDPDLLQTRDRDRDQDRLRDFDRLQDRVRDMTRDLEEAHDVLRKMIGKE